jgi:hypothetical protein
MSQRKPTNNPFCSVPLCRTKERHTDDPIIKALLTEFSDPARHTMWVLSAITELARSINDDFAAGRVFAAMSRSRQPEELYFRSLYAIFLASPDELAHIVSGKTPNSFSGYYREVNRVILEGRGELEKVQPGRSFGSFTAMETINNHAHVSYPALGETIGIVRNPEYLAGVPDKLLKHHFTYVTYLDHARKLFEAGRDRKTVMQALVNMHRPMSYYVEKAKAATEQSSPPSG